jgi:hypothetical protein
MTMTTKTKIYKDLKKIPAAALPRKLSETLRVALEDLAFAENSSRFIVDMGCWFQRFYRDKQAPCEVCFAGSVMARTLGVSFKILSERVDSGSSGCVYRREAVGPEAFRPSIRRKLEALNSIRQYRVIDASASFYGKESRAHGKLLRHLREIDSYEIMFPGTDTPSYEADRETWGWNMTKIADRLEAIGL